MISKETFVNTMCKLHELHEKMNRLDEAVGAFSDDNRFYSFDSIDITLSLLEKIFRDEENGWIAYCVFERDWLKSMTLYSVTDAHDEPIDLTSWDKVYDFLITEMCEEPYPCSRCDVGWGSASTYGVVTCEQSCEKLASWNKRKNRKPYTMN